MILGSATDEEARSGYEIQQLSEATGTAAEDTPAEFDDIITRAIRFTEARDDC